MDWKGTINNLADKYNSWSGKEKGALSGSFDEEMPSHEPYEYDVKASVAALREQLHSDGTALQGTQTGDLDVALSIAEQKGKGSAEDIYNNVLFPMAYHESAHTMDPNKKQIGGGPGRGLLQFEKDSAKTSVQRAKNLFKKLKEEPPEWLDNIKEDGDVRVLTGEQQMALAVYDLLEHPKADLGKVTRGEEDLVEFWADNWWAGKEEERDKKIESFNASLKKLKTKD